MMDNLSVKIYKRSEIEIANHASLLRIFGYNSHFWYKIFGPDYNETQVISLEEEKRKLLKEQPMSEPKKSLGSLFVEDTKDAAYEVAAKQIAHGARKSVVKLVENLPDNSIVKKVADSKLGEAAVSTVVGLALPHVSGSKKIQRIAQSMRKNGLSTIMTQGFGAVREKLFPKLQQTLNRLPDLNQPKLRIEDFLNLEAEKEASITEESAKKKVKKYLKH